MNTNHNAETKSKWDCFSINDPTPRKIRRMRRIEQKRDRKRQDREREALRHQPVTEPLSNVLIWPEE